MKKIIFGLILLSISCKAQIIPVEQVVDNYGNVEDNITYIKDVNNVLDDYVGTWKGTQNDIDYTFMITERTIVFDEEYNVNQDVLIMKHLIVNSTTLEIIEDTTLISDEDVHSEGGLFRRYSSGGLTYMFYYGGNNYSCGQNGEVNITLKSSNSQMYLRLNARNKMDDCTTGFAEQVLPTEDVLLTKQ